MFFYKPRVIFFYQGPSSKILYRPHQGSCRDVQFNSDLNGPIVSDIRHGDQVLILVDLLWDLSSSTHAETFENLWQSLRYLVLLVENFLFLLFSSQCINLILQSNKKLFACQHRQYVHSHHIFLVCLANPIACVDGLCKCGMPGTMQVYKFYNTVITYDNFLS